MHQGRDRLRLVRAAAEDAAGRAAGSRSARRCASISRRPGRELFDIVRVGGIATFTELITTHGRGRGCDICKPVVASILASLGHGHILDGEQAALQDTNDHFLANIQTQRHLLGGAADRRRRDHPGRS